MGNVEQNIRQIMYYAKKIKGGKNNMAKQTLKQRIGTGIVLAAAGLGSLIGLSGCETTPAQNYAISGVVSQNAAIINPNISYRDSQIMGISGGLLGVLAQQEAMKEAAREVKPTVVNVNSVDVVYLKDYGDGWIESALLPHRIRNIKTKDYAPQPGYIWKNPHDTADFEVIFTERDLKDIKDYEIKPRYDERRFGPKK